MRTLRIEKGGRLLIEGELVDMFEIKDRSSFISSLLTLDVELSDDILVGDIIHLFYDSKEIIRDVLSEEYEAVRAIISTTELPVKCKEVKISKFFKIEKEGDKEFIYLIPEIELVVCDEGSVGSIELSELNVVIDESISLVTQDLGGKEVAIKSKSKINLLDILTCFFEDLPAFISRGIVI